MGEILTALAQLGRREYLGILQITDEDSSWQDITGWDPQTNYAVVVNTTNAGGTIEDSVTGLGVTIPETMELFSSTLFARTRVRLDTGATISVIMYKQYV